MIKRLVMTLVVLLFAITSLYPLLWVVLQSLKRDAEFFASQFSLPREWVWHNYADAWSKANFALYYKNTLIITSSSLIFGLAVCILAGYAFAKIDFVGRKTWQALFVAVLFVPSPVLLMPVFFINRDFGLINTYMGMVGPYICGAVPLGVLLMSAAFRALPGELSESARIDGCGEWRTFIKILFPLTLPTVATLCILQFISVWTDYMWPLIANTDPKMYTITVGMTQLAAKKFVFGYGPVFAGMVITTFVVILLYIVLQRYFVRALTDGAVKG
ncbi:carbohydrate ABC transporter permease [Cohnella silvisoli]|uniref:Carbohydrate ABC transporter permease n=1 Tax=Cohnella silvisoli TaxID=2873699 RepID=A0ABV1L3H4_9BACL|nr:carbohydrate ABC transporter permease [Cohnella silvisoli]MCD9025716.1 carbohydrate ABC transporter permease [Cohnella silvisoli]